METSLGRCGEHYAIGGTQLSWMLATTLIYRAHTRELRHNDRIIPSTAVAGGPQRRRRVTAAPRRLIREYRGDSERTRRPASVATSNKNTSPRLHRETGCAPESVSDRERG